MTLTKNVWLVPHISKPENHHFLITPRVVLELDYNSGIILPLFSVWNSLPFALKNQQGLYMRLTIGEYSQLHRALVSPFTCCPSPYCLLSFFCISSSPGVEAELKRCLVHICYISWFPGTYHAFSNILQLSCFNCAGSQIPVKLFNIITQCLKLFVCNICWASQADIIA